jgi:hypothetical protein
VRGVPGDELLDACVLQGDAVDLGAVVRAAQDGQFGEPDLELGVLSLDRGLHLRPFETAGNDLG